MLETKVVVLALAAVAAAGVAAEEPRRLELDPDEAAVSFLLDATLHEVHGTAVLTRGELVVDEAAGEVSGAIVVDATSLETGNGRRDRQMHERVLASGEHPEIVFSPDTFRGSLDDAAGESRIVVAGRLALRGVEHAVELPLTLTREGDGLRVRGELTVPYVAWGLPDPSRAFLRVAKEVVVSIDVLGRWDTAAP